MLASGLAFPASPASRRAEIMGAGHPSGGSQWGVRLIAAPWSERPVTSPALLFATSRRNLLSRLFSGGIPAERAEAFFRSVQNP